MICAMIKIILKISLRFMNKNFNKNYIIIKNNKIRLIIKLKHNKVSILNLKFYIFFPTCDIFLQN